jgi:protein-tyrosine phosphatase
MKIMFVCTGNICRSPLAEAVFRGLVGETRVGDGFEVESSGTTAYHVGQETDGRMRAVAEKHGVRIRKRSKQLQPSDLDRCDLILAMDRSNLREIGSIAGDGGLRGKVKLFREFDPQGGPHAEVPDPYYGGHAGFEMVFGMIDRTCRALFAQLRDKLAAPSS